MGCFQPSPAIPGKTRTQVKLQHLRKQLQKWEQAEIA